jgi:hypothetical protein
VAELGDPRQLGDGVERARSRNSYEIDLSAIGDKALGDVLVSGNLNRRRLPKRGPTRQLPQEERRVDVALQRIDPAASLVGSAKTDQEVNRRTVLKAGTDYRLTVRIGRPFAQSIVEGDPPSIDSILPKGRIHRLDVVIFGLDFKVIDESSKPLRLPRVGASPLVSFVVRTPIQVKSARLRIGIFKGNHLLQSFLLQAVTDAHERHTEQVALTVALEFSRTTNFSNLKQLRPRAMSVGINQGPTGTHSLMIKRNGVAEAISFQWQVVKPQLDRFRAQLQSATYNESGAPRFPVDAPMDESRRAIFDQTIREFADLGKELYDGLWQRAPLLEGTLRRLRRTSDETIQVVRFDVNNVLPWPVLYDYPLPQKIVGAEPHPICLGWGEGVEPGKDPVKVCSHGPANAGFCIYGFWGIRHTIEELLVMGPGPGKSDPCFRVMRASKDQSVWLSVDQDDTFTLDLRARLDRAFGSGVLRVLQPGEDLIDLLWQKSQRPEMLIVVGHLETDDIQGQPAGPRIVLPGPAWLQPEAITQRAQDHERWREEPHVLTLLMACGSVVTDAQTLNNFVTALSDAGASAVVGTEAVAFTGLVAHVAGEIATQMWTPTEASLGAAVKDVRRRLVTQGNPLGFVFSFSGSADLTLAS